MRKAEGVHTHEPGVGICDRACARIYKISLNVWVLATATAVAAAAAAANKSN